MKTILAVSVAVLVSIAAVYAYRHKAVLHDTAAGDQRNTSTPGQSPALRETKAAIDAAASTRSFGRLDTLVSALLADEATTRHLKFETLWAAYGASKSDHILGRYFLDALRSLGPAGDITVVIAELRGSGSRPAELTLPLLQLVAANYREARHDELVQSERNAQVVAALKEFATQADPAVTAKAATLLSRVGPVEESISSLKTAYQGGQLSEIEYVRELTIQVPALADSTKQAELIEFLVRFVTASSTREASLVFQSLIVGMLQSDNTVARMAPAALTSLAIYLAGKEPALLGRDGQLHPATSLVYTDWCSAMGRVHGRKHAELPEYCVALARGHSDPSLRLAALLTSPRAGEIAQYVREDQRRIQIAEILTAGKLRVGDGSMTYHAYENALWQLVR